VERRHLRWRYGEACANLDCKNVLRWLNPSESKMAQDEQRRDRLAKQQSASFTCQWLLQNPIFLAWASFETAHNVLWINGKAGTGKSVLSAFIIDSLRSIPPTYVEEGRGDDHPSKSSKMSSKPTVLFFFCGIDRASENPWSFIGSLIHQLISDDHIDEEQKERTLLVTTKAQKAFTASAAGSFRDWRYLSDLLQKLVNDFGRLQYVS
jgi:Cdc6-like AAA superfamily ATPase